MAISESLKATRRGYKLTEEAEEAISRREDGGCSCHNGCAPCSWCVDTCSLETAYEIDEYWEVDEDYSQSKSRWSSGHDDMLDAFSRILPYGNYKSAQEFKDACMGVWKTGEEMSREQIVDKSGKKELTVGKWYRFKQVRKNITTNNFYEIISISYGFHRIVGDDGRIDGYHKDCFDIDSEIDIDPTKTKETLQTEVKESRIDSEELFVSGKYYCCIKEVPNLTLGSWYRALVANQDGKSICVTNDSGDKVWWSKATLDPSNGRDHILGNLPQGKAGQVLVRDSNGAHVWQDPPELVTITLPKARVNNGAGFQLNWNSISKKFNILNTTKEESNMANRRVVNVKLIDNDKGLDVSLALVHDFGEVLTEDDNSITIQQLIVDNDLASLIDIHNGKRTAEIDLEILERTGNEVYLRAKKLKDFEWIIK